MLTGDILESPQILLEVDLVVSNVTEQIPRATCELLYCFFVWHKLIIHCSPVRRCDASCTYLALIYLNLPILAFLPIGSFHLR